MADVKQTIQDFYTQAQSKDFARTNLFRVLNIDFGNGTPLFGETDLVYARTATLPAKAINNVEAPYMGLKFNVPGVVDYPNSSNYTINFYCDEAQALREKFLNIVTNTFDDATSTGNYFMPKQTSVMDLVQLNKQLVRVAQYQLVGVSIRNVGELAYDMTSNGDIVSFDVSVAYHYFRKTG
jgi:hypothetical protein